MVHCYTDSNCATTVYDLLHHHTSVWLFILYSGTSSELYHAERWHEEFPAVMTIVNDIHIVNDFVRFDHHTVGKVLKLFKKVNSV